jgi:hypothetical protein
VKETLIRGQLKNKGCNFSFLKKKSWVYKLFWYVFLHNINYKCKSKNLSKYLIFIYVNK